MKTVKKKHIIFLCVCALFVVASIIFVIFHFHLLKKTVKTQVVNVFGEPRSVTVHEFPAERPEFAAVVGNIHPSSVHQESITIYKSTDTTKKTLFDRNFYADGFHGKDLAYSISSQSATFTQSGILRNIGCEETACFLPWTNFYVWSQSQNNFILDNVSHKDFFENLLTIYSATDKNGCKIAVGRIISSQNGLSFSQLFTKYPNLPSYCSASHGILQNNVLFFLKTQKAIQEIIDGKNIGSGEIQTIEF